MPSMTEDGRIPEIKEPEVSPAESNTDPLQLERRWFESQMQIVGAVDRPSPSPSRTTTSAPPPPEPKVPPPPPPAAVEAKEYFNEGDGERSEDWEDLGKEGAMFNMDME